MGESLLAVTAKLMPSGKLSVTPASETVGAVLAEARAGKTTVADITMIKARRSASENGKGRLGDSSAHSRLPRPRFLREDRLYGTPVSSALRMPVRFASYQGWISGRRAVAGQGLRRGPVRRRLFRSLCGGPSPSYTGAGRRSGSGCPILRRRARL